VKEADQVYEFATEGQSRLFGRDDTLCDIVIWSAINGSDLARVAGCIWRREDELWVRNLSTSHDLLLRVPGLPPEPPLPPRATKHARGAARSIPAPECMITGPAGCEIVVLQEGAWAAESFAYGVSEPTVVAVPPVPQELHAVAVALCAPLIRGGYLPATYSDMMRALGENSLMSVRSRVQRLCSLYVDAIPALHAQMAERKRREDVADEVIVTGHRRAGVVTLDLKRPSESEPNRARREALQLPDYYEVAMLLVRHRKVGIEDVVRAETEQSRLRAP